MFTINAVASKFELDDTFYIVIVNEHNANVTKIYRFEDFKDAKSFFDSLVEKYGGVMVEQGRDVIIAAIPELRWSIELRISRPEFRKQMHRYDISVLSDSSKDNITSLAQKVLKLVQYIVRFATNKDYITFDANTIYKIVTGKFYRYYYMTNPQIKELITKENGELLTFQEISVGLDELKEKGYAPYN